MARVSLRMILHTPGGGSKVHQLATADRADGGRNQMEPTIQDPIKGRRSDPLMIIIIIKVSSTIFGPVKLSLRSKCPVRGTDADGSHLILKCLGLLSPTVGNRELPIT